MRVIASLVLCTLLVFVFVGCGGKEEREDEVADRQPTGETEMEFIITSTAFGKGESIPSKYTCDGEDISPPLGWENPPEGAKSFALISDDPDAPGMTWVHWVVWAIPATRTGLAEGVPPDPVLDDGTRQGTTDFRRIGYGGPCPPSGTHRYFFKLYALDNVTEIEPGATKKQILEAVEGHILARTQLLGTYKR